MGFFLQFFSKNNKRNPTFILDSRVCRIYDATFEMFCPHCDSDSLLYLCSKSKMQSSGLKEVAIATVKISFFFCIFFLLISCSFLVQFFFCFFLIVVHFSFFFVDSDLYGLPYCYINSTIVRSMLDLFLRICSRKSLYSGHCLFFPFFLNLELPDTYHVLIVEPI